MTYPLPHLALPENWTFALGDLVCKKKGSQWRGRVVGFYSSSFTAEGYAIESLLENGNVQVYPVAALERWEGWVNG